MTRPPLGVWLYGTHLATLFEDANRRMHLEWTGEAFDRWGLGARVMSHLLPIQSQAPAPPRVEAFLSGLLPEGNLRTNYAMDIGVDPDDTFALIRAYGRDTAGALVFAGTDETAPDREGTYEPISSEEAGRLLQAATRHAPAEPGGAQSTSLAGMHPKIAVHRVGDQWFRCRGGAPSTWILKVGPDEGPAKDVLDTEVLCNELARAVGLTRTRAELVLLGDIRAIAVERYDRTITLDGRIERVHQEDLAQALGLNTQDPDRKFQRGRPLPSLRAAAEVVTAGGADTGALLALAAFSYLVGNTDMHAKNISFMRWDDGAAALAPAYDISAHAHHNGTPRISALCVNGKIGMDDIGISDFLEEARSWPGRLPRREQLLGDVVAALSAGLDLVDRAEHPGVSDKAFETIADRVSAAAGDLPAGRFDRTPSDRELPRELDDGLAQRRTAATQEQEEDHEQRAGAAAQPPRRRGPRRRRTG